MTKLSDRVIDLYCSDLTGKFRTERTVVLARTYTTRLLTWLEDTDQSTELANIDHRVLRQYLVHLSGTLSPTTVGIHFRSLRAFFNWMYNEDLFEGLPLESPFARKRVVPPKIDYQPPEIYTTDEISRLLGACAGKSFENIRDRAIIWTLLDSGARLGELVSMTTTGTYLTPPAADVTGKTGPRRVPLGQTAAHHLRRYLFRRDEHALAERYDALWLSGKGPLGTSGVSQMLKRRGKEAGVEGVRPHRFRHTWAHEWKRSGGSDEGLQRLAGWQSPAMAQVYGQALAIERAHEEHQQHSPGDRFAGDM